MKYFLTISALALCGLLQGAEEFCPGGVSVDFARISQERFSGKASKSVNYFTHNWKPGTVFLHTPDPKALPARAKAIPLIKFSKSGGNENFILKTEKPVSIFDSIGKYAKNISASWTQTVNFPDNKGGEYRLRFKSKLQTLKVPGSPMSLVVISTKSDNKNNKTFVKPFRCGTKDFAPNELTFQFPEGTVSALFYLRLDNCGIMEIESPVLEKVTHSYPVEATLHPFGKMDNTFVLSQNDPALITFVLKRNVPVSQLKVDSPVFEITLPKEVEFVSAGAPLKFLSRKGNTLYFDASFWKKRLQIFDGYETHMKLPILVTTKAPAGECREAARFQLTDGGKLLSEPTTFKVRIAPQIPAAAKGSIFLPGYQPMGIYLEFEKESARKMFAEFSGRTGFRWICLNFDEKTTKFYRDNGTTHITPELYWLANGYRIGPAATKPEYAKYKAIGKTTSFDILNGTCPAAIYNKTPFYTDVYEPYLKKELKGKDGVISNWEPFMFHGQGCFCDTCRDEFADFVKISKEEMKKLWPKELTITGKYYKEGVRFRSIQHGKLVKTIHASVNKFTSGKAGFIPEIVWIVCADTNARGGANGEHDPLDYASSLTYIDPWGPYTGWQTMEPWNYTKGENLSTYVAAKYVRRFMTEKLGKKCPRLVALPHGIQGKFWVTTPEAMAMEVTGFFLQGYHAAHLYLYPHGYDNRYWRVMAENNSLIALHEDVVFNGKRLTGKGSVTPVTPYPAPKKRINPRYLVNPAPESLLQIETFCKGNVTVAAVGNFWQKGDVFFTLKIQGLEKNTSYALTEVAKKRTFVNDNGKFFTGAELEKGVLLHAGALRWVFFTIEKSDKAALPGKKIFPRQLKEAMKAHLPAIEKGAAEERVLDEAIEAEFRKSELRPLANGALKCTPAAGKDDSQVLLFNAGKNTLTFELQNCTLKNWTIDGILWGEAFGVPMFWEPANAATARYTVTKQEVVPEGIRVVAEKLFNRQNSAALEHLTIRQTILVSKDLRTLKISTELIDSHNAETGSGSFTLGFRYHFFPGNMNDRKGDILMSSKGKELIFTRKMKRQIYALGMTPATQKISKLFECADAPVLLDNGTVFMRKEGAKDRVRMQGFPQKLFGGYAVWDTPDNKFPTFEPFFQPVTIKDGQKAAFSIELKAEKIK